MILKYWLPDSSCLSASPAENCSTQVNRERLSEHTKPLILLGRAPYCDFVLQTTSVSWEHCTLSQFGNKVLLTDQNSSNGTWVNGNKIDRCWLSPGDNLQIGSYTLLFCGVKNPT